MKRDARCLFRAGGNLRAINQSWPACPFHRPPTPPLYSVSAEAAGLRPSFPVSSMRPLEPTTHQPSTGLRPRSFSCRIFSHGLDGRWRVFLSPDRRERIALEVDIRGCLAVNGPTSRAPDLPPEKPSAEPA